MIGTGATFTPWILVRKCCNIFIQLSTIYMTHSTFLPLRIVKRNAADKPWINEKFRLLVKRRQYAWTHNNISEYKIYRNQVQRMARKLKANYYKRCSDHCLNCRGVGGGLNPPSSFLNPPSSFQKISQEGVGSNPPSSIWHGWFILHIAFPPHFNTFFEICYARYTRKLQVSYLSANILGLEDRIACDLWFNFDIQTHFFPKHHSIRK